MNSIFSKKSKDEKDTIDSISSLSHTKWNCKIVYVRILIKNTCIDYDFGL